MIFLDSYSVPFICWKNPGGSIWKNGKLKGHVYFVYQALFFLTELPKKPCAEPHESNSRKGKYIKSVLMEINLSFGSEQKYTDQIIPSDDWSWSL